MDSPTNADSVWVSICDITEIGLIKKARRYNKPIIAGGFISFLPVMRLWADYVCVGEAYNFVKKYSVVSKLEDLEELPECATKSKEGIISQYIDYEINPIVRVSNTAYYWYSGKGCPIKCKFCLLSWSREWQEAPEEKFHSALNSIPKRGKLYPMASMLRYKTTSSKLGTIDVRLREYISGNTARAKRIRFGIEFWSERYRKAFGKPYSNNEVSCGINRAGNEGTECTAYIITGVPGDNCREFLEALPSDTRLRPKVILALTYLDPQPMTPIAEWDIREKVYVDGKKLFGTFNNKNRRIRVQGPKYMAHSSWRTIMQRAQNEYEAEFAWAERNNKDNDSILSKTERAYPHLLGSKKINKLLNIDNEKTI